MSSPASSPRTNTFVSTRTRDRGYNGNAGPVAATRRHLVGPPAGCELHFPQTIRGRHLIVFERTDVLGHRETTRPAGVGGRTAFLRVGCPLRVSSRAARSASPGNCHVRQANRARGGIL